MCIRDSLHAVFVAQVEVEEHQAYVPIAGDIQGALEATCQDDTDTEGVQAPRDEVCYSRFVIDDQDSVHSIGPRIDSTLRVSAIGEKGLVK